MARNDHSRQQYPFKSCVYQSQAPSETIQNASVASAYAHAKRKDKSAKNTSQHPTPAIKQRGTYLAVLSVACEVFEVLEASKSHLHLNFLSASKYRLASTHCNPTNSTPRSALSIAQLTHPHFDLGPATTLLMTSA